MKHRRLIKRRDRAVKLERECLKQLKLKSAQSLDHLNQFMDIKEEIK
jgi:hypothetical protein